MDTKACPITNQCHWPVKRHIEHPRQHSCPFGRWGTRRGHHSGPRHSGTTRFFKMSGLELWQVSQKWVRPKQKYVAGEQQYAHLNSMYSFPCPFVHTPWPHAAAEQPPQTKSKGLWAPFSPSLISCNRSSRLTTQNSTLKNTHTSWGTARGHI